MGIKCGSSDTTSGLSSNIVAGLIADRLIDEGGTVVFTETAEVLGAEHLLAGRADDPRVGQKLLEMVAAKEQAIKAMGVDLRRCEPTPGNILGGLTTIEEKSLGAIVKAGSRPLMGVLEWGQKPAGKGLYFMDGPSHTAEICTGEAAAGAQILIFSLGGGLPSLLPMVPAQSARFPIMPVVKLVGNPHGFAAKKEFVDTYVGSIIEGTESAEEAAERAFTDLMDFVCGRRKTVCERFTGYGEPLNMYFTGPLV
jgi:altronate dehydratase large subunit